MAAPKQLGQLRSRQLRRAQYAPSVGNLRINAINARRVDPWILFVSLGLFWRWELTCGFCKNHFQKVQPSAWSTAGCPVCGSRNLASRAPVPLGCRTSAGNLSRSRPQTRVDRRDATRLQFWHSHIESAKRRDRRAQTGSAGPATRSSTEAPGPGRACSGIGSRSVDGPPPSQEGSHLGHRHRGRPRRSSARWAIASSSSRPRARR